MSMIVLNTAKLVSDRTVVVELRADDHGRLISLTNEHYKIHAGDFYGVGYYITSLANGGTLRILLQVPAGVNPHASIKVAAGGDATFSVYENVTFGGAGTSITPVNHNRCFADSSLVVASHTPTTPSGDLIWSELFLGGSGGVAPGAIETTTEQVILCENTNYMFEITNISGTAQPFGLTISYYETT